MKVLLASDGTASARHADDIAAAIEWPDGTEIDVLCVDQLFDDEVDLSTERFAAVHVAVRSAIDERLATLSQRLAAPGRTVRARVVFGRPATVIVAEAAELGSDLVILGSHDRGALASLALGSVSAEVVDHAPCPVLVARRPALGAIVLGHDGSDAARQAEELIAGWPFLARETVQIVSVAPLLPSWYLGAQTALSPAIDGDQLQRLLDEGREDSEQIAAAAVARLRAKGVRATAQVRDGTPAAGLLESIAAADAQLVVLGSRGNTGLSRLLLGSVARTVLYQASCSVLIVRGRTPIARPFAHTDRSTVAI